MGRGRVVCILTAILSIPAAAALAGEQPRYGACCTEGRCTDREYEGNCARLGWAFYHNVLCSELVDCRPIIWACCNPETGVCVNRMRQEDCERTGDTWHDGQLCADFDCAAGCDGECQPGGVWYVDADATSELRDGRSWCSAFATVQEGLAFARLGGTVRVAAGRYTPDTAGLANPRKATFSLRSGITLAGGHAGCGAADPDRRNILGTPSILSGDLGGDDGPNFENNAENVYHVVTAFRAENTAILDGFVITGGHANGPSDIIFGAIDKVGGGMLSRYSYANIRNSHFWANSASLIAGGVYVTEDPLVTGCEITGNLATGEFGIGAGGAAIGGGSPRFDACTMSANVGDVGGVIVFVASLKMRNAVLWANANGLPHSQCTEVCVHEDASALLDYCNVEDWDGSLPGKGTFSADPQFVDPVGSDGIAGTLDDDLSLRPGSPCIDAGDPALGSTTNATDITGVRRVLCGRIDIGAFEFAGDLDCDRDVDLRDYAWFQGCMGESSELPCRDADVNADDVVDESDFRVIWDRFNRIGGP